MLKKNNCKIYKNAKIRDVKMLQNMLLQETMQ